MLNPIDQLFNMAATIKYLMVIVGMSHTTLSELKTKKYHWYAHNSPNDQLEVKQINHIYVLTQKCDLWINLMCQCVKNLEPSQPVWTILSNPFITKYHVNKRCFPQCSVFIWNYDNHWQMTCGLPPPLRICHSLWCHQFCLMANSVWPGGARGLMTKPNYHLQLNKTAKYQNYPNF